MPKSRAVRSAAPGGGIPRLPMRQMQRPVSAVPPRAPGAAPTTQPVLGGARPRPARPAVRPKAPGKLPMPSPASQGPNPQAPALARAKRSLGTQKRKIGAKLPQAQGAPVPPAPANPMPAQPAFGASGAPDDADQY
jgi:hypothetical protein